MSGSIKTNVFILNKMYQIIIDGCIGIYNPKGDPGTLFVFGRNNEGQLGDGTVTNRSSPVQIPGTIWNDIAAGQCHSLARKTDGGLWAWGGNNRGQLGDGTVISKSSPIQIPGTTWNDISAGSFHSLARKTDGTLWAWGYNDSGQLGQNNLLNRSSPIQVPGTTWNGISAGGDSIGNSLARRTDGTLWAWGGNPYGQLGDGTVVCRSSPIQIPGTTWNDIAAGQCHSLARKTDGTLWSWGGNISGQLGDCSGISSSSPVQVPGTTWNDISAGMDASLARKTDGTLWSWGYNASGQLGDNTITSRNSPVQVPGTTWIDITIAKGDIGDSQYSLARKTDCTLWAWGKNSYGQLGQNDRISRSSPVQIPGTTWNDISAGSVHTLARKVV